MPSSTPTYMYSDMFGCPEHPVTKYFRILLTVGQKYMMLVNNSIKHADMIRNMTHYICIISDMTYDVVKVTEVFNQYGK